MRAVEARSMAAAAVVASAIILPACAQAQRATVATPAQVALVDRVTWGIDNGSLAAVSRMGSAHWLDDQLRAPPAEMLPPAAQAQIDAMRISTTPLARLIVDIDAENHAAGAIVDPAQRQAAQAAVRQQQAALTTEAATRALLRDLYARGQLREQLVWFWTNQFNVQAAKRDIRPMIGDYEERAIRPHVLGRYRDLLEATLRHPAMLRYLDNDQNAVGHINENYAREIMELHSMGVGSGYTQKDVQELARILTGVGVSLKPGVPRLRPEWARLYIRSGLFEFNPARHDFGDKLFLGHVIRGSGYAEVEQALDLIAAAPATAHHVAARLAQYFIGDDAPPALVDRLAGVFQRRHGDTAQVLRALFRSREFAASLDRGNRATAFKDPVHYAVSAVRLTYGDRIVTNVAPLAGWIGRMGEGLYAHETPDGYPLSAQAWTGPGQMAVRFEIAHQIGGDAAGLFRPSTPGDAPAAFPQLQNALYFTSLRQQLSAPTRSALAAARSSPEWNALLLSSPDFMRR